MKTITAEGLEAAILPDCAQCSLEGKHPEKMECCPLNNFDRDGFICIPELCDHYTED